MCRITASAAAEPPFRHPRWAADFGRFPAIRAYPGPAPDTILGVMNARSERPAALPLVDPFERQISYLRVSVTDRCDFRCVYCMAEDMTFLPKADLLTLEELDRLCSAFIRLGVRKLRLTGGEPLVRRNVMSLIGNLGRHLDSGALDELTLTTNGSQLAVHAEALRAAGVRRLNVSLDTLDPQKFQAITRWGHLDKVLDGIDAAKRAGLAIKLNVVALKGVNEDEFDNLVAWCGDEGFDLTFIEVMPMGEIGSATRLDQYLPLSMVRARLQQRWTLEDIDRPHRRAGALCARQGDRRPDRLHHAADPQFLRICNRVRLTCTGTLYMCLGQEDAADLRAPLRASESDDAVEAAIREAITRKPKGHDFVVDRRRRRPAVGRHMSVTGG